ncbi:hypothetical protein MHYP_G00325590 [Metynnis hypsauchen]
MTTFPMILCYAPRLRNVTLVVVDGDVCKSGVLCCIAVEWTAFARFKEFRVEENTNWRPAGKGDPRTILWTRGRDERTCHWGDVLTLDSPPFILPIRGQGPNLRKGTNIGVDEAAMLLLDVKD